MIDAHWGALERAHQSHIARWLWQRGWAQQHLIVAEEPVGVGEDREDVDEDEDQDEGRHHLNQILAEHLRPHRKR